MSSRTPSPGSPHTPSRRRITGFALAVEIGDWERFTGGSIGAYLGLVPSEHSSGQSRVQARDGQR
jgi:transposase